MTNNTAKQFRMTTQQVVSYINRSALSRAGSFLSLAVLMLCISAAARADGIVKGALFMDFNADGVKQAADTGIPFPNVELRTPGGNNIPGDGDDLTVASATPDGSGNYSFTGLAAGTYYVHLDITTIINGILLAPQDQGSDDNLDSDFDPTTGNTPTFSLGANNTVIRDAGSFPSAHDLRRVRTQRQSKQQ
jgi:hypothetical protein